MVLSASVMDARTANSDASCKARINLAARCLWVCKHALQCVPVTVRAFAAVEVQSMASEELSEEERFSLKAVFHEQLT